jgi:FkbM family methyltransferase
MGHRANIQRAWDALIALDIQYVGVTLFEQIIEELYSNILRPKGVGLDIGAHRGRHTIPMARIVGREGKIHAVEGSSTTLEKLKAALNHCGVEKIRSIVDVHHTAVSDFEGTAEFWFFPQAAGWSGLADRDYAGEKSTETVTVTTIDKLWPSLERLDFIKIDVEGAELSVVRGGAGAIGRLRPVIAFENEGEVSAKRYNYTREEFFGVFEQLNYSLFDILGCPHLPSDWDLKRKAMPWNFVAVPRELEDPVGNLLLPSVIGAFARTIPQPATP